MHFCRDVNIEWFCYKGNISNFFISVDGDTTFWINKKEIGPVLFKNKKWKKMYIMFYNELQLYKNMHETCSYGVG